MDNERILREDEMGEHFLMLQKCGLPYESSKIDINKIAYCNNGKKGKIHTITFQKNNQKLYKGKTEDDKNWQATHPFPINLEFEYFIKRLEDGKFKEGYTIERNCGIYRVIFDLRTSGLKNVLLRKNLEKGVYYNTFENIRCVFLNLVCIYELGQIWNDKEKRFVKIFNKD